MTKLAFDIEFGVYEKGRKVPQWTIDSDINGELSLEDLLRYTKTNLLAISEVALKEEQANGFDKNPVVKVDGRVGKPVINVNPLGSIEFISKQSANTILLEAYDAIMSRAPRRSGLWAESNFVFLNGKGIATNRNELESFLKTKTEFADRDVFRIVNVIPYARKLERHGVTGQRTQQRQTKSKDARKRSGEFILAPNGAYFLAYRSISRKYKSNSKIRFGFVNGSDVGLAGIPAYTKTGKPLRRTYKKSGRSYLYPSISISLGSGNTGIK